MTYATVNPLEGQVAVPYQRAASGWVVGCLTARAMTWVEQAVGRGLVDIWFEVQRRAHAAQHTPDGELPKEAPSMPVGHTAAILWAAIEAHRRRAGLPGPEYTVEDAEEIIDQVGLDDAAGYAVALITLSLPFRPQREQAQADAAKAGLPDPFAEVVAAAIAATAGNGSAGSTPPAPPA